jgi:hypothetical protein
MRWCLAIVLAACGGGGQSPPGGEDAFTGGDGFDGGSPATFFAVGLPGGLDRLVIAKSLGDTCVGLTLVNPGNPGSLSLPSGWALELAFARQPAAACDPRFAGPIAENFDATAAAGTIEFTGAPFPQVIGRVAVDLEFAGAPSWCPPFDTMATANLPVQ